MCYKALDIAKYTITESTRQEKSVSNLKLQIILYYLWRDYNRATGNILFTDYICARQFGPYVPEVYYEFSYYAGTPIAQEYEVEIHQADKEILDNMLDSLLNSPLNEMARNACLQGKAWDLIYKAGEGDRRVIPFDLIIEKDMEKE